MSKTLISDKKIQYGDIYSKNLFFKNDAGLGNIDRIKRGFLQNDLRFQATQTNNPKSFRAFPTSGFKLKMNSVFNQTSNQTLTESDNQLIIQFASQYCRKTYI